MQLDLEPLYLYILSRLPIRRLVVFEQWLEEYGSFEEVYLNPPPELAGRLPELKAKLSPETLFKALAETGVNILPYYDERYPKLLREIYDAPAVLFYRGRLGDPDETCIAMVGSRKMSAYGAAATPLIARPLINAGVTIVSGLAYGADSAAHAVCVGQQARTIAVLGSGVDDDSVYPRAHLRLAHEILDCGGLLISEHPPGTPGLKQHFVARNRIIAGLSSGIVITECKVKSGALITADFAADFNRNLYAVPGPIYSSLSAGPHQLIKSGAALISSGEEILADMALSSPQTNKKLAEQQRALFTATELRVLECMQDEPVTIDALTEAACLPSQEVANIITTLELKGYIKSLGMQGFIKT